MTFYTYAHYRATDNSLFYIGKGKGSRAKSADPRNPFWSNIVKKHNFKSEILAIWKTEKEALEHEKFLIKCFREDLNVKLCNMTDGGEGRSGFTNTLEVRVAHSKLMSDPKFNPSKRLDVREKLTGKNNPMYGLRGKSSPHYGKARPDQSSIISCPHCNIQGGAAGVRRWHFDNCKFKGQK
jgi:hypothetical protein